jgi:hypothetical protein
MADTDISLEQIFADLISKRQEMGQAAPMGIFPTADGQEIEVELTHRGVVSLCEMSPILNGSINDLFQESANLRVGAISHTLEHQAAQTENETLRHYLEDLAVTACQIYDEQLTALIQDFMMTIHPLYLEECNQKLIETAEDFHNDGNEYVSTFFHETVARIRDMHRKTIKPHHIVPLTGRSHHMH